MTEFRKGIDPVTLEVIRNRMDSIVREMGDITLRTARSAVVYAGRDFSCGILNDKAELLSVGTSIPIHIFPIVYQVKKTLSRYEGEIKEGDIFVGNDPYDGGTHLNDVLIFIPIFYEGEIVGYAANRAHWYDIGGMVPGSLSGSAREIFQEGLRIPPIRLGENDSLNPDIMEFILRNVRVPNEVRGDILAQVASCRVASSHVIGLMNRYGKETTIVHFDEVLNSSERRMRTLIKELPEASAYHEGYMDNDGVDEERKRICVTIEVQEDELHVDYTGTDKQTQGPLNVGVSMAHCFAFMGVKAALDPPGPINSGCFRPIKVTAPKGTMLNASSPAPAGGMGELGQTAIFTMAALGKLVPDRISSEEGAGANHQNLAGTDSRFEDPHRFIYYDYPSGGSGARKTKDGPDFVRTLRSGNVNIQSLEVVENLFPVLFHRHELRQDSGGPGEFRGGMGAVREYETPSDGGLSILSDHSRIPPAGISGGHWGAHGKWEIFRQGQSEPLEPPLGAKITGLEIQKGDTVRISTAGGGGYGEALDRDPILVLDDVSNDKVSLESARDVYGVVIDATDMTVDTSATARRRDELRRQRIYLAALKGNDPQIEYGMRTARLNPSMAEYGVQDGDMAEAFSEHHPPAIRMKVKFNDEIPEGSIEIDQEAWTFLELKEGEKLLWRLLPRFGN